MELTRLARYQLTAVMMVLLAGFVCTADEKEQSSAAVDLLPGCRDWLPDYAFKQKRFTFVRIQYSGRGLGFARRQASFWATDYPDADRNLSAQLQRHTTLDVDPNGKVLKLTDPALSNYPFIYMVEPGRLVLTDEEVLALRRYLLSGGFLMLDDFWGEAQWQHFYNQIKRVFPEREPRELPLQHGIFHCAFDLEEKPQVPSIHAALSGQAAEFLKTLPASYHAIYDDNGRMMVIACHNTDLADGWEREQDNEAYYQEFGAKKAYPMAINIIFFALTQ